MISAREVKEKYYPLGSDHWPTVPYREYMGDCLLSWVFSARLVPHKFTHRSTADVVGQKDDAANPKANKTNVQTINRPHAYTHTQHTHKHTYARTIYTRTNQLSVMENDQRHQYISCTPGVNDGSTACIDQNFVRASTSRIFKKAVHLEWRGDSPTGRSTWAVVGCVLEVNLLCHDLIQLDSNIAAHIEVFAEGSPELPRHKEGKLLIMTFQQLHRCLRRALVGGRWRNGEEAAHMTIIMNFGWGNVSYDMAMSSVCLLMVLRDKMENCTISATVITSSDKPLFSASQCRGANVTPFKHEDQSASFLWQEDNRSAGQVLCDIEEARGDEEPASGRAILLMESCALEQDVADDERLPTRAHLSPHDHRTAAARDEGGDHLILENVIVYLGSTPGLAHVVVSPHTTAGVYDDRLGRAVAVLGTALRSRAAIEHVIGHIAVETRLPEIRCLMTRAQYEKLPLDDESTSETLYLDRLLLSCVRLVSMRGVPLGRLGFSVSSDEHRVERHLRRHLLQGLLSLTPGPSPSPLAPVGRRLMYSLLKLTPVGIQAEAILDADLVEDYNVACLLALWGSRRSRSTAVTEAVFCIASVAATQNGVSVLNMTFYADEYFANKPVTDYLPGVAGSLVKRGCIWFAIAMWQRLRVNPDWRGLDDTDYVAGEVVSELTVDEGHVWIDRAMSFQIDRAFDRLDLLWPRDTPKTFRENALTEDELLEVEEMLVRAFIDKLMFVVMPFVPKKPFAFDVTSKQELGCPIPTQEQQLHNIECWQNDIKAVGGHVTPGFFCIYTAIERETKQYIPADVTYVSWKSVANILSIKDILQGF